MLLGTYSGNALARVQRVHETADLWDITFCTRCFETQSSQGCTCTHRSKFLTHSLRYLLRNLLIQNSKLVNHLMMSQISIVVHGEPKAENFYLAHDCTFVQKSKSFLVKLHRLPKPS